MIQGGNNSWRASVKRLAGDFISIDKSGPDGGLREAMLRAWLAMSAAPSPVKHDYAMISEARILTAAGKVSGKLITDDFGFKAPTTLDDRDFVLSLGGFLRAVETELSHRDEGGRPLNPEDDWLHVVNDQGYYVIPLERIAWRQRKAPAQDKRPFTQRGLLRFRIVPQSIEGADVKLYRPERISSGRAKHFGAALFEGIHFQEQRGDETFRLMEVSIGDRETQLKLACDRMIADGCLAVVLPELTVDDNSLQFIKSELSDKSWLGDAPDRLGDLGFVVAGSWHKEIDGEVFANIATVLDNDGTTLLEYHKRLPFRDPEGNAEGIRRGTELPLLILDEGLFGFAICLDFCDRTLTSPYDRMDVDYVLVPSCGNEATMSGHLRTAMDLDDRVKTRSFVVQQAYPNLTPKGLGYVLPPGRDMKNLKAQDLVSVEPWQTFAI